MVIIMVVVISCISKWPFQTLCESHRAEGGGYESETAPVVVYIKVYFDKPTASKTITMNFTLRIVKNDHSLLRKVKIV